MRHQRQAGLVAASWVSVTPPDRPTDRPTEVIKSLFSNWSISIKGSDVLTYGPIIVSLVAIYYSRRAFVYQKSTKRSEQIALVSLQADQQSPKLVLSNPSKVPLIGAECWYYHRDLGAYQLYIDCNLDKAERYEWSRFRASSNLRQFIRPERLKRPYGKQCTAEAIVLDGTGEEWYINTRNKKIRLPRRFASSALVRHAIRWGGHPPWLRLGVVDLPWILLWLGNLVVLLYFLANSAEAPPWLNMWLEDLRSAVS